MEFTFECCDLLLWSFEFLVAKTPDTESWLRRVFQTQSGRKHSHLNIWVLWYAECLVAAAASPDTAPLASTPSTHTQLTKTFEISYHDTMILYESTHNSPNQSTHTQLTYYLYSDFHHGTVQVHPHSINSNFWNPTIAAFHFDLDFHHHDNIASQTVLPIWALPKTFCW